MSIAPVSLVIVNARVRTGDPRRPWADGIAVRDDQLAVVGSSAEVRKLGGTTARVIDAKGGTVVPGVVDPERIDVERALRVDAGRLERGGLADFVLLDGDLARLAPEAMRDVRVLVAVVGGRVVYER